MWLAQSLRYTARIALVILAMFWFVFALLSGSEQYGGGLNRIIRNSPNALPWLLLFVLDYVEFRWELIGGILIILAGVLTVPFFNTLESLFLLLTVSLPLMVLGGFFTLSWYITNKQIVH